MGLPIDPIAAPAVALLRSTQLVEPNAHQQVEDRRQEDVDVAEHSQSVAEERAHEEDPRQAYGEGDVGLIPLRNISF